MAERALVGPGQFGFTEFTEKAAEIGKEFRAEIATRIVRPRSLTMDLGLAGNGEDQHESPDETSKGSHNVLTIIVSIICPGNTSASALFLEQLDDSRTVNLQEKRET